MNATPETRDIERIRREVATWCDGAGQRYRLRTPELRPSLPESPTSVELAKAVEALVGRRHEVLGDQRLCEAPRGRLLVCRVSESICSGESEHVTEGFFDVDDRPPWDTWVLGVVRPDTEHVMLISWVPLSLVALVNRGIEVNPYECIFWLDDAPEMCELSPLVRAWSLSGSQNEEAG
jgi:hypothetical protein